MTRVNKINTFVEIDYLKRISQGFTQEPDAI